MNNKILIIVDTLRYDAIFGNNKAELTNITNLIKDSIIYQNAYSATNWTLPSHASIFTGKNGREHGINEEIYGGHATQLIEKLHRKELKFKSDTLAQSLYNKGMNTIGVSCNGLIYKDSEISKGFAEFYDINNNNDIINKKGQEAVNTIRKNGLYLNENFFLFINLMEMHYPIIPNEPPGKQFYNWISSGKKLDDAYVNKIKNAYYGIRIKMIDNYIGMLITYLKKHEIYDKTDIVLTTDHGEVINNFYYGHGKYLVDELLHSPFIYKNGIETGINNSLFSTKDIFYLLQEKETPNNDKIKAECFGRFDFKEDINDLVLNNAYQRECEITEEGIVNPESISLKA